MDPMIDDCDFVNFEPENVDMEVIEPIQSKSLMITETTKAQPSYAKPLSKSAGTFHIQKPLSQPRTRFPSPQKRNSPQCRSALEKRPETRMKVERPSPVSRWPRSNFTRLAKRKRQGTSILDFDPTLPPHFTEKATVDAIKKLGISDHELQYPTDMDLSTYSKIPKIREVARKKLIEQVDNLIAQIKEERVKQIQKAEEEREKQAAERNTGAVSMSDAERRFEKAMRRQKHEVEQLLLEVLMRKMAQDEENQRLENARNRSEQHLEYLQQRKEEGERKYQECMRAKLELEEKTQNAHEAGIQMSEMRYQQAQKRLKEEQQQRNKEIKDEELRKLAKVENNMKEFELAYEQRQKDYANYLKEMEEKDLLHKQEVASEQERLREYHDQLLERRNQQMQKLESEWEEQERQFLQDTADRDARIQQNLDDKERERQLQIQEAAKKGQEKMEYVGELQRRSEQEIDNLREELENSEQEALSRYQEIGNERCKRLSEAREAFESRRVEIVTRKQDLEDEDQRKKEAILTQNAEQEERFRVRKLEQTEQNHQKAVVNQIVREQRTATAHRIERSRAERRRMKWMQIEERIRNIEVCEYEKERSIRENNKRKDAMEAKRIEMTEQVANLRHIFAEYNETIFEEISSIYGLDINLMKEKAKRRRRDQAALEKEVIPCPASAPPERLPPLTGNSM